MTIDTFQRIMAQAKIFHELGVNADYWRGVMRGCRRAHHGDNFGTDDEHQQWLTVGGDLQRGYKDGLFGVVDDKMMG